MDTRSNSSKGELDSITSADSLQILTDEFRLNHISTPDVSNAELLKKIATLELDSERLRIDLENARLELSAKNAANQGLKSKIAELYVEAQVSLQEKQKLYNSIKDAQCQLAATESSTKWYQGQLHEVQANKKTLQIEIDTYQNMLRQKSQMLMSVNAKYKQLSDEYLEVVQKHKKEKDILQAEIKLLQLENNSIKNCTKQQSQIHHYQPANSSPTSSRQLDDLTDRLESVEEELRISRAEINSLEKRLRCADEERAAAAEQRAQLTTSFEESLRRCQSDRAELAETNRQTGLQLAKLRAENDALQLKLLASRQEREQVENAIEQLRLQLTKMLAQHKLLKGRNVELEVKLGSMEKLRDENERLKSLAHSANASLIQKLRQERRKVSSLQKQLSLEQSRQRVLDEKSKTDASLRDCLRQALERNKELREQLKLSKQAPDESVDEGYYADSCGGGSSSSVASLSLGGSSSCSLPSPRPLSPSLLNTINDVLSRSKDFWQPIKLGLDELQEKLEYIEKRPSLVGYCGMPTPPSSPSSNSTRSVA